MKDQNAQTLLAKVMEWADDEDAVKEHVPVLQLLADYKYDQYQRFGPGKRFIESLALWLNQFDPQDRKAAFDLVRSRLVYVSEAELSHLVQLAYPDVIVQERMRLVAEEHGIPPYRVGAIKAHPRFRELQLKSLYLGLSDGARTNELRRASWGEISNEQIWQAYELGEDKATDMLSELAESLVEEESEPLEVPKSPGEFWKIHDEHGKDAATRALAEILKPEKPTAKFNLIWLLDDFSGSGNTYIRFDTKTGQYKGKIKRVYERLARGDLNDPSHYDVYRA